MKLIALVSMVGGFGSVAPTNVFEVEDPEECGRLIVAGYAKPVEAEESELASDRETADGGPQKGRSRRKA